MPQYKLTPEAKADLNNIAAVSEKNFGKAQRLKYIKGLRQKAQQLADKPNLGRSRHELFEGLKSASYVSHMVYYVEQSGGIVIIRILHKRMEPQRHLSPEN